MGGLPKNKDVCRRQQCTQRDMYVQREQGDVARAEEAPPKIVNFRGSMGASKAG